MQTRMAQIRFISTAHAPSGPLLHSVSGGRLGSAILRILHILIWVAHTGHLFVDDYIFSQAASVLPATGAMICMFFQCMGIPLSWHKLQIAFRVSWIGWDFQFSAGIVMLKESKRLKSSFWAWFKTFVKGQNSPEKDLERFIGLALWATNSVSSLEEHAPHILS